MENTCLLLSESKLHLKENLCCELDNLFKNEIGQQLLEGILPKEHVDSVMVILGKMFPNFTTNDYRFINQTRMHVFAISLGVCSKYTIKRLLGNSKLSNINFNLIFDWEKHTLLLVVNWNLSPVKTKFLVHGKTNDIFDGSGFIRHVFNRNYVNESKDLFILLPHLIDNILKDCITTLIEDIKMYWGKRELKPYCAKYIALTMLPSLQVLMSATYVRHGVNKFKVAIVNSDIMLETIDNQYEHHGNDASVMCSLFIAVVGELLERVADQGYEHLLRGYIK